MANVPHRKSKSQHNKEGILDKATPTWLTIFFLFFFWPSEAERHLLVFSCLFSAHSTFLLLLNASEKMVYLDCLFRSFFFLKHYSDACIKLSIFQH